MVCAISVVAIHEAPPLWAAGYDVIELAAFSGLIYGLPPLLARGLMSAANAIDTVEANIPDKAKDGAGFVKSIRELKGRTSWLKTAPYWGTLKGRAIFAAFQSNALILGPAGTSKDVSHAGPNILALAGKYSKVVMDMKSDMAVIYADALQAAGEEVIILNYGNLFSDRLESSFYNPPSLIADNFSHGSISDVAPDATEMALQIHPEPVSASGDGNGIFFRNGSRKLIRFSIIICILIDGASATLGDALALLQDKDALLHRAKWACGRLETDDGSPIKIDLHEAPWAKVGSQSAQDIDMFAEYLSGLAASIADLIESEDSRTYDSFIEGALGEMDDFNITTKAHKVAQASEFRFRDLKEKDGIRTVFICGDSSRPDAYKKIIEITVNNMFKELMRCESSRKDVYVFGNEITNFKINNLEKYLTFLRSYRVKLFLYVQSLAAFRQTYGKDALQTLLSETEVKYILPGQRDPETLKLISDEMLGLKKIIRRTNSGNRRDGADGLSGLDGFSYAEDKAPLRTTDKLRRQDEGILFLGNNRPTLIDTFSIASIWPFRHWQGLSPFYDKPYRERIKLILWRYLFAAIKRQFSQKDNPS